MFDAVDRMGQIVEDSLAISTKKPSSSKIHNSNHEREERILIDQLTPEEIYRFGDRMKSEEEKERDRDREREREKKREWEIEKERRVGADSAVLAGYKVIAVGGGREKDQERERVREREMERERDRHIAREREREKDDLNKIEIVRKVEKKNEIKDKLELENDRVQRMLGREGSLLKMDFQPGTEKMIFERRNPNNIGRTGGAESFLLKDDGDGSGVKWVLLSDQTPQQDVQDRPLSQCTAVNYGTPTLISE